MNKFHLPLILIIWL